MEKLKTSTAKSSIERKLLLILTAFFIVLMASVWAFSMNLRKTLLAKNAVTTVDARALVEVERLRNLAESENSNSLTFFLMGASNLFDLQKKDKHTLTEALASFEKQFALPGIPAILKKIETARQQQQEFFDQGMDFRAKQTESKIVGQFFRAKVLPLRTLINKAFDEIIVIHNAEFERSQNLAQATAHNSEAQIPQVMMLFTILISTLFAVISLLVLRMVAQRLHHNKERLRLYHAAIAAAHTRDGLLSAVSNDLTDPLDNISQGINILKNPLDATTFTNAVGLLETSVSTIEDRIKDILDETKAENGNLILRVEQIGLNSILDDTQLMLEPVAKLKDVRLEFSPVNPPVLAFIDRERVMRVLTNLVGNAIKFSPKQSKVIVKVRSDQQFVFVSVRDSGPGIPEKQAAQIFTHFWQAKKTAELGAGVGLAVVKSIIEAHSGLVTLETHVGHGSTFTISLPRRRPAGALLRKPVPAPVRFVTPPPAPAKNASAELHQ